MELFVGNITTTTTLNDVVNLFRGFASKAHFRMVKQRMENGSRAYYAVVNFDSDKLAFKAIKKLNGTSLHGSNVVIREFIHRSYSNERRALNWRDKPWSGPERRSTERRNKATTARQEDDFEDLLKSARENEKEESASISISAYSNMARKF